ncbi:MAG TPA: group III truncated hemoglobin [Gemmatimonadaceae bacterium]
MTGRRPELPIVAPETASAPAGEPSAARPALRDEDLHSLLVAFYDTVGRDELLAPYFAPVDMSAHMPRIVDFWSTLLFHTGRYSGNAFRPHLEMPGLSAPHFARWVETMERTIDAHAAGPAAEHMKALAHRIAYSMQLRLGIEPFADFRPMVSPDER